MRFRRDFELDLKEVERMLSEGEPFALARFHDGEHALMEGKRKRMAAGWRSRPSKESWIVEPLFQALGSDMQNYGIATSPPCCQQPSTKFYSKHVKTQQPQRTFATLFQNANYSRARQIFLGLIQRKKAIVVSSGRGDFKVPAQAMETPFDIDAIVDVLLKQDRIVLLSAGPLACTIAHRYWDRRAREGINAPSCIDVGASIDAYVHGRDTRHFHNPHSPLARHECQWEMKPQLPRGIRTGGPQDFPGVARHFSMSVEEARKERLDARRAMKRRPNWARGGIRGERK